MGAGYQERRVWLGMEVGWLRLADTPMLRRRRTRPGYGDINKMALPTETF